MRIRLCFSEASANRSHVENRFDVVRKLKNNQTTYIYVILIWFIICYMLASYLVISKVNPH